MLKETAMATDPLIDALVADLAPVRTRPRLPVVPVLIALLALETALATAIGGLRPDLATAVAAPGFWWKLGSLGLVCGLSLDALLASMDPVRSPRPGLVRLAGLGLLLLAVGWLTDALTPSSRGLMERMAIADGLHCFTHCAVLALPPLIGLGLLLRRGAPTHPATSGLAAGLAAASWGGLCYMLSCDQDEPLFVTLWYGLALLACAAAGRFVIGRLARW
jgi:hypothetical protein